MLVEAAGLTRDTSYWWIAAQRCPGSGISEIVNALLEGVFIGFEEDHVRMSPEIRSWVHSTIGREMESSLFTGYVNKIVGVYEKALAKWSEEDLQKIVQCSTVAGICDDDAVFGKFLEQEEETFLPIKEQIVDELVEAGKQLFNDDLFAKIHEIATAFDCPSGLPASMG